jgi:pyruvate formate lyase activating enzyme
LVSYEYVFDTSVLAKKAGLKTVVVTNGTIEATPLRKLLPTIDAFNIDLKGFTQTFYDKLNGNLEQVKRTIEIANESSHVEVTTLVIPGENDDDETMEALAKWLASVNPGIQLHLTRFFPAYLWRDKPATPLDTLDRLREIALKHVSNVYLGNI